MDTSIRLKLALGELKVPAAELEPAEWVPIVRKAVDLCRPQLKYFSGFQSAAGWAHGEGIKRASVLQVNNDHLYDQQCLVVSRYPNDSAAKIQQERLLLNKNGVLIHWLRQFGPRFEGLEREGGSTDLVMMDTHWTFSVLAEDKALQQRLNADVGEQVLMHLHLVAKDAWLKRVRHAEAVRDLVDSLVAMRNRIG